MRNNTEVKFPRTKKNCSLNEDLLKNNENMDSEKDIEVVGSGTPSYAAALNDHKKRSKAAEASIGKYQKAVDKIIQDINKDAEDAEDKQIKKTELNESLFEAYVDNALAKRAFSAVAELTNIMTEIDKVDPMHEYIGEDDEAAIDKAIEALNRFGDVYRYVVLGEDMHIDPDDPDKLIFDTPEEEKAYWYDKGTKMGLNRSRRFVKTQDQVDAYRVKELFKSFKATGDAKKAEADFRAERGVPEGEDIIADDLYPDEFPIPKNWELLEPEQFSSVDPWLAVYDELSNAIDQEADGDKQQVDKKLDAERHERYDDVRPYGDNDIIVYTDSLENLEFAKSVADYYANLGVTADAPVEHKGRYVPDNQRWSMVFRIPQKD